MLNVCDGGSSKRDGERAGRIYEGGATWSCRQRGSQTGGMKNSWIVKEIRRAKTILSLVRLFWRGHLITGGGRGVVHEIERRLGA
jgi:hypothetical protein